VETVHNAAVTKYNNQYIMLFRSHKRNGRSIIGIAISDNGFNFKVRSQPFIQPEKSGLFSVYEKFGVEDPRICKIDEDYYITYSVYSEYGVRIALAKTQNFEKLEKISFITEADYRNIVLFPEKINGLFIRLDRPHSDICPWSIWISYSPDMVHWGNSKVLIKPEKYHWDEMKVGPGATPIKTSEGWLNIFHGVFSTMSGSVYRLGVALHDLEDPSIIIGVADDWILQPEDDWEVNGYVHNVVFTCGVVAEDDESVKIYWGGADTVMCVGTAKIQNLLDMCINSSRSPL
jgi:predicted GH43/DUF377 family glycosyl hydrolase